MAIYIISDLHFNHKNIMKMCRPQFETIEEHNEYIISQYNSVVGSDDLVYFLGDIGFTPAKDIKACVQRLNGRKVLIIGNHDKLTDGEYRSMGFIEVHRHPVYYNTNIILSHIPIIEAYNNPYVYNIHGHLHGSRLDLPNFFNVNAELNDFKPYDLKKLAEEIGKHQFPNRWAPFGQEWYHEHEKKV